MLAAVGIARCSVSNKSIIHGYTSLITQWGVVENMIKGYKGNKNNESGNHFLHVNDKCIFLVKYFPDFLVKNVHAVL